MASDQSSSLTSIGRAIRLPLLGAVFLAVAGAGLALAGTASPSRLAQSPEKFLADNEHHSGVQKTPSGLQYKVIKNGKGAQPKINDVVSVEYQGSLTDGTVFDSTARNGGAPVMMPVARVIPGFSEALQLMKQGGRYRFWIPPQLGYGAEGAGGVIPPNAVLIFDVKLVSVVPAPPAGAIDLPSVQ
ncbi:MAG: FKBP-type peptidyl-prolyl cis-trans isomerase [Zymomonas mobilis]|uniref:Peptidyl-prolyl cis-trans isomerase n=1 Tax=Zymomonas mobilis TaxID=542 RepID=A0A542W354_ZYMMB|nr:FKBP-type peptidyl-prolyl cis-trans isomerase [Zymomonas mobilis]TQL18012.1 peptidylprolyl isomerase [Zymomonas mobilis]